MEKAQRLQKQSESTTKTVYKLPMQKALKMVSKK